MAGIASTNPASRGDTLIVARLFSEVGGSSCPPSRNIPDAARVLVLGEEPGHPWHVKWVLETTFRIAAGQSLASAGGEQKGADIRLGKVSGTLHEGRIVTYPRYGRQEDERHGDRKERSKKREGECRHGN